MGSATALTYPTENQYERWQDRADKLDMTMSEFLQSMVEAGMKVDEGFEPSIEEDESKQDIRQQRNRLKKELDRSRERVSELEDHVYYSERKALKRYLENNPGASFEELVEFMKSTVAERMNEYLDGFYAEPDGFYPTADGSDH